MDYIVLETTINILEEKCRKLRLIGASAVGSLWAVVALVGTVRLIKYKMIICLITYIPIALLMLYIILGKKNMSVYKRGMVILYVVTFALSGLCSLLWNYMSAGYAWVSGLVRKEHIILGVCILYLMKVCIKQIIKMRRKYSGNIYRITLWHKNRNVMFKGLLDSGNVLTDPYSGKMIHIICKKVLMQIIDEDEIIGLHYRLVPFCSVGQKKGLLPVIDIENMEIFYYHKSIYKGPAAIGIYEGELTGSGHYECILNSAVLKN